MTGCVVCGGELDRKPGAGRPPRYCGQTCRRTREFEIRRRLRQIERAEDREQACRFELEADPYPRDTEGAALRRKWWAAEVERLEDRLLRLLR